MRDHLMVLFGGFIVATAFALWNALNRRCWQDARPRRDSTPGGWPGWAAARNSLAAFMAYSLYAWVASLKPGIFAPDQGGRYLTAGVIVLAAVYQLTPDKNVSLI